jgi:hypothetical protein
MFSEFSRLVADPSGWAYLVILAFAVIDGYCRWSTGPAGLVGPSELTRLAFNRRFVAAEAVGNPFSLPPGQQGRGMRRNSTCWIGFELAFL